MDSVLIVCEFGQKINSPISDPYPFNIPIVRPID